MARHYERWGDKGTFAWGGKPRMPLPKEAEGSDFIRGVFWGILFSVLIWLAIGLVLAWRFA